MLAPAHDHQNCACHNPVAGTLNGIIDNKHVLVLIDGNAEHRREVKDALISFYTIFEFDNRDAALEFMDHAQPGIVLVGESVPPSTGASFISRLQRNPKLRHFPTLLILEPGHHDNEQLAINCGAGGWLAKPYRRSALVRAISKQLNSLVEKHWETLPPVQAKALKGTVEVFNSLSDVIHKGEPIVYSEMNEACAPLVDAVNSGDYKGILGNVKDHDNYTYSHSLRVAIFLSLFGRAIGLALDDQKMLATGGLLHDVGKTLIPHAVLNKPGRLTPEEFEIMKGHVNSSIEILERSDIPKGVIIIAAQHHEKLDGTGYPKGIKGSELNQLARMASIVDVFGALTDRRVYKDPVSPEKALEIMTKEMSTHLDIPLLNRFREMLLDASLDMETDNPY